MKMINFSIFILTAILFYSCASVCCRKDTNLKGRALKIKPYLKKNNDGNILFRLESERISENDNEYLPSSESFRVVILSENGKEIWNSSFGKVFMTVITKILPEKTGDIYTYEMVWDGKDNSGKSVPPGKYKAILMIPAKPKPYTADLELDWSGK